MIRINDISLPLGFDERSLRKSAARAAGISVSDILSLGLAKKSVDARHKNDVRFTVSVFLEAKNEQAILDRLPAAKASRVTDESYAVPAVKNKSHRPAVVGFGPAGMLAALTLAQAGLCPTVLERGSDVDARTAAVEAFRHGGAFSAKTNVQFGEGGAGTFSDGKLTTGIRDSRISHVFRTFVRFGAPEEILYSARPHIGTDILVRVVKRIREEIISLGGSVIFGARMTGLLTSGGKLTGAEYEKDGEKHGLSCDSLILCCGHSARDTFTMLRDSGIAMEKKSFAMGVRIEHLQSEVNKSLYGSFAGDRRLPPADYKYAVHLPSGRSLFTFCMCPGGSVIAAASEESTVVTNGMSLFARDGKNANSALLVNTEPSDCPGDILGGMELQRRIEQAAFAAGGRSYGAPVILAGDLLEGRKSASFGSVEPSYIPSVSFASPQDVLPEYIVTTLCAGLPLLAKKASFFAAPDAVITMPETRSSSPVRILRGQDRQSVSLRGLYPCGEGAGYAGGIVSAAVDGMKCAEAVIENG